MFTTVDSGHNRGISCIVTDIDGTQYDVLLEKSVLQPDVYQYSPLNQHLLAQPLMMLKLEGSQDDFKTFAKAILDHGAIAALDTDETKGLSLVTTAIDFYKLKTREVEQNPTITIASVTLRLWRKVFTPQTHTLTWEPLREEVTVSKS